jgi:ribose transport system permease protein
VREPEGDSKDTSLATPTPQPAGAGAGTAGDAATPTSSGRAWGPLAAEIAGKYGLLITFLLTIAVFCILRPDTFATTQNAESILTLAAPPMIMAVGLTVVLVMQDFDLSFGAMIGLAGGAVTTFIVSDGIGWGLAILMVLGIGVVVGILNGFMVAYLGGNSFIITLAMGTVLTGVEFALTGQDTVFQGLPLDFLDIASGSFLGYNNQIWIAIGVIIVAWLLMDRTELGRYMYAIGGNQEAARLSGIRVRPYRVIGFIAVGLAAAIVGILMISLSGSYSPNGGATYLLPAFAAAFLGAAVFRPGEFNIPGTVVGVLFLGVIQTGLIMLNTESYVINLVQGGILIAAVLVSRLGQRA